MRLTTGQRALLWLTAALFVISLACELIALILGGPQALGR